MQEKLEKLGLTSPSSFLSFNLNKLVKRNLDNSILVGSSLKSMKRAFSHAFLSSRFQFSGTRIYFLGCGALMSSLYTAAYIWSIVVPYLVL